MKILSALKECLKRDDTNREKNRNDSEKIIIGCIFFGVLLLLYMLIEAGLGVLL